MVPLELIKGLHAAANKNLGTISDKNESVHPSVILRYHKATALCPALLRLHLLMKSLKAGVTNYYTYFSWLQEAQMEKAILFNSLGFRPC